jgi:hypothetical protein
VGLDADLAEDEGVDACSRPAGDGLEPQAAERPSPRRRPLSSIVATLLRRLHTPGSRHARP